MVGSVTVVARLRRADTFVIARVGGPCAAERARVRFGIGRNNRAGIRGVRDLRLVVIFQLTITIDYARRKQAWQLEEDQGAPRRRSRSRYPATVHKEQTTIVIARPASLSARGFEMKIRAP